MFSITASILLSALLACRSAQSQPTALDDSPAETGEEGLGPCEDPGSPSLDGVLTIDRCWTVVASEDTRPLAEAWMSGALLMGCEDELPEMLLLSSPDPDRPFIRLELDESLDGQAYRIRHDETSLSITGGSLQGLRFGLSDWVASLDRVDLEGGAQWRPDPTDTLSTGPTTCSDYDATCADTESCWRDGAWTPVERVLWRTQEVDNGPQVQDRIAFASFKGTQNSHFLPNLVYAELGSCESPQDTSAFWEGLLGCDRQSEGTCLEVQRRLDAVVAGRFTQALDEGHPMSVGDSVERYTGCDGAVLYQDFVDYLALRGVELVPTVYGLETRIPGTPVAGPRISDEDPAELWGVAGDATLSQGLGLSTTLQACALDAGTFLSPGDCSLLDEDGHVQGPLWVSERYDADTLAPPESVGDCGPLELCATKSACWEAGPGHDGQALWPAAECNNPVLRWILPQDGRWYALHFEGGMVENRDLQIKLITKDIKGFTNVMDVELLSTTDAEGEYLNPLDAVGDARAVRYSVVFRAPAAHARLQDAYLQIMGAPGAQAWVDNLQLAQVEGQLRHVDADSVLGPGCLVVHDAAQAPLAVDPFFEGQTGQVLGGAAFQADCLSPGEQVQVAYRSWTHFGLWPGIATRQKTYTYSPGVFNPRYWEDATSPTRQVQAMGAQDPAWMLISDLGGEARGVDRLDPLVDLHTSQVLSAFVCQVESEVCEGCGDCSSSLLPLSDPGFAPCACADWETDTGPRLLIAGDMYSAWHNGGDTDTVPVREGYQVPHGGDWEGSWEARHDLPSDAVFLTWWHYDSRRAGKAVGGQETALGFVLDYAETGHATVGASAWDPDNQRVWAALAAGTDRTHDLPVAGVAQFGWGSDAQGPRVMANAGRWFWNPGWSHVAGWLQSTDAGMPGGDESSQWSASGMHLEPSTDDMIWPQVGDWQVIDGDSASWVGPMRQVRWEGQEGGERVLVRFYATLPAGCSVQTTFAHDGPSEDLLSVTITPDAHDHRVWSASVDLPTGASSVRPELSFAGCAGGVLDAVTLYASLPVVDFPYAWEGEGFEDWPGEETVDARFKICGDVETWDCVNGGTWE